MEDHRRRDKRRMHKGRRAKIVERLVSRRPLYSWASSCSMATRPWRFSATRAARRSRIAWKKLRREAKRRKDDTYFVFDTTSLHLVGNHLSAVLLGLSLVNELHQHTFVLVNITLGLLIERVVTGGEDEIFQGELWKRQCTLTDACQSYLHLCTSSAVSGVPSVFSSIAPL